jgi:DeoR/GlpR family transcriptional regulator of sugar metabolism
LSDGVAQSGPAHAIDRRHVILERVAADGAIHVADLARDLRVSEMTIRRDLRRLERDGFLRQTYGGATAHLTRSFDLSFNARALQHARAKRLIGMTAARLVGDAHTLFIGIGTTAEQFARSLTVRPDMLVVTASLPIASLLGSRAVRVVATGGAVLRDELSCVGSAAAATLARYRFQVAVIGAAGMDPQVGLTELTDEEAEIQRIAIARSDRVIVIADGSKVGARETAVVMPADRAGTLVTDSSAPAAVVAQLRALGVTVHIADADRDEPPATAARSDRRPERQTDRRTRATKDPAARGARR